MKDILNISESELEIMKLLWKNKFFLEKVYDGAKRILEQKKDDK